MNKADGAGDKVGDGVGLITSYTMYGELSTQDTGLRNPVVPWGGPPGEARPAFNAWGAINQPRGPMNEWQGWIDRGMGQVIEPGLASYGPGRLEFFVRRSVDPQLWHGWYSGGWAPSAEPLGGHHSVAWLTQTRAYALLLRSHRRLSWPLAPLVPGRPEGQESIAVLGDRLFVSLFPGSSQASSPPWRIFSARLVRPARQLRRAV